MTTNIEQTFSITDSYTMNYGATIIDEHATSGYSATSMSKVKSLISMKPQESLYFYPEIIDLQNELGEDSLSLATTWINGFTPLTGSLPTKNQMHRRISSRMHNRGIATSEQLISVRNDSVMNTLFSNFKWNNGGRIVELNKVDDSILNSVVLKTGSICNNWIMSPPQIRFMVRQTAFLDQDNEAVPDYLYLLGGSNSIIYPEKAIETIKKLSNINKISQVSDNYWYAQESTNIDPLVIISRICFGIIMTRNYLKYAKHHIGIRNIVDIDFKRDKSFVDRDIDDVIEEYEPSFIYCRNISNLFGL